MQQLVRFFLFAFLFVSVNSFAVLSGSNTDQTDRQKVVSEPNRVNRENDDIVKPKLKANSCGEPVYPLSSSRNNEEGKVGVKLLIDEAGNVIMGKVTVSSGFPVLDDGAITFLSQCKFEPATQNGKPIKVWYPLNHNWRLAENHVDEEPINANYRFEGSSKPLKFMDYVKDSCTDYVVNYNQEITEETELLGIKKIEKKDMCECAEKRVYADKYLKLVAAEETAEIEKIMDDKKFKIYVSRKMGSVLMECMAKSIDTSLTNLDPRKK